MVESRTTSITPAEHADNHRTGGTDPLTGAVGIDAIDPPAVHGSRHAAGGADPVSILNVSDTTVFTGTCPTTFTDLDLSAVVGAQQRLVLLEVQSNHTGTNSQTIFRKNGSGTAIASADPFYGCHSCRPAGVSGECATALCVTDTAGVVEWLSTAARAVIIRVLAYI